MMSYGIDVIYTLPFSLALTAVCCLVFAEVHAR
jgi:hypothetical protein